VPLLPASLTEPLWVQFSTLLKDNDRPEFVADHPWGCHRRQIPDRVVFDHVLAALVHGSGYERIATPGCSDRTIRRRLAEWAERNVRVELLKAALAAYDQMIGLDLDDLSSDGSITTSPCGGNCRVGPRSTAASKAPNARWSPTGAASPRPGRRRRQPARLTPVRTHHAPDPGHDRSTARAAVCAPRPRL